MQTHITHSPAWQSLLTQPDTEWDLCYAALLIASRLDEDVDVENELRNLDELAGTLVEQCHAENDDKILLQRLNEYFTVELGFHGDTRDYYQPHNSLLHEVIARRCGIPISLSIVYLRFARSLGLTAYGIGFPGHFLVGVRLDGQERVIDPFNSAQVLRQDELMSRLREHVAGEPDDKLLRNALQPVSLRAILVRMLRNLKQIYMEKQDVEHALVCIDMILSLLPESPEELRDRGMIYQHIDYAQGALNDLRRYLELVPDADERSVIEAVMQSLDSQPTSLH